MNLGWEDMNLAPPVINYSSFKSKEQKKQYHHRLSHLFCRFLVFQFIGFWFSHVIIVAIGEEKVKEVKKNQIWDNIILAS